jgi:hypothetical protein
MALPSMLSKNRQNALQNYASDASTRHLLKHAAAIVNTMRENATNTVTRERIDYEVPGTGLPIKWGTRFCFATAGHVVGSAIPSQLRVATFADWPDSPINPKRLTDRDLLAGAQLTEDCEIHRCSWEDLAAITVDAGKFPGVEFVEVDKEWIDPPVGEPVHFCGFPTDHSVEVNRKRVTVNRDEADLAVWPTVISGQVLPFPSAEHVEFRYPDLDEDRHYLIPYNGAGVSKNARGVSGSAVWWEPEEPQLVWRPTFRFAGMCVAWFPRRSHVQVVKASTVIRFLSEIYTSA